MIKLTYRSCDGYHARKTFKTLAGASAYARRMVGDSPELGSRYAVSGDGVGTIRDVEGATLTSLFPARDHVET